MTTRLTLFGLDDPAPVRTPRRRRRIPKRVDHTPKFQVPYLVDDERDEVAKCMAWFRLLAGKDSRVKQDEIDDRAQEIALKICITIVREQYKPKKSKLTTWAARVGPRHLNDHYKREQRQKGSPTDPSVMSEVQDEHKDFDAAVAKAVREQLKKLPKHLRRIVKSYYGLDCPTMSLDEIAEYECTDRKTIKARLREAKRLLNQTAKEDHQD